MRGYDWVKQVGTHNLGFHSDDALATACFKILNPDVVVIRTRDKEVLDKCDIVYDVGDGKYDHHQKDAKVRENGIKYSAFGLVWDDFGKDVIRKVIGTELDDSSVSFVHTRIIENLVKYIDATDNGVTLPNDLGIRVPTLATIVGLMEPYYDEDEQDIETAFNSAVDMCKFVLERMIKVQLSIIRAKYTLEKSVKKAREQNKKYIYLDENIPWRSNILDIEEASDIPLVVYKVTDEDYRVQVIPAERGTTKAKMDLPAEWAGLRDVELSKAVGVEGCIFCHAGRFLCGNKTAYGAIKMAEKAIKLFKEGRK